MYPAIAKYISETYLAAWEEELERRIFIIEAPEFAWDKYRIEFQGPLDQIQHKLEVLKDREAAVIVHKSDPA
jgi:ribonuclease G